MPLTHQNPSDVTDAGMSSVVRLEQPCSALLPIAVTPSGITSSASELQPLNTPSAIVPTAGRLMAVSDVHPVNAELPSEVTVAGIVTVASALQPLNASEPTAVTPSGMAIEVIALPIKAFASIEVTLGGKTMLVRLRSRNMLVPTTLLAVVLLFG